MATLIFGVAGAFVSTFLGAGPQLGFELGALMGGILFPPGNNAQIGKMDDLRVTTSSYGTFIQQVWGSYRCAGQVIWSTPLNQATQGNGKGGTVGPTVYTYSASFAVLVCRGPITSISRIWFNNQIVYDVTQSPTTAPDVTIEGIYTGTTTQTQDPLMLSLLTAAGEPCSAFRDSAYVVFENAQLVNYGNALPNVQFEVIAPGSTAADIVTDLLTQCGLDSSMWDVSQATQAFIGFSNPMRQTGKAALDPLVQALNADIAEYDGKIVWVPRGNSPCRALTADDIGAVSWPADGNGMADDTVPIKYTKRQYWELPTEVDVAYFQWNSVYALRNYLQAMQAAIRSTLNTSQNTSQLTFPMTIDDDYARQTAERLLYQGWIERDQWQVSVGPRHADLVPTDILLLTTTGGVVVRTRVVQKDEVIMGVSDLTLTADNTLPNTQFATGGDTGGMETVTYGNATAQLVFQTSALTDAFARDGNVRLWFAYAWQGGFAAYSGAATYLSIDGGSSYFLAGTDTSSVPSKYPGVKAAVSLMGSCYNTLGGYTNYNVMDTGNVLYVTFVSGTPSSCSSADLANGVNALFVGGELLQFQTATLHTGVGVPANTWGLTNLLRGQRGTDWAMNSHVSAEMAVYVDATLGVWSCLPSPEGDGPTLGTVLKVKFVPQGQSLGGVTPVDITLGAPEWTCYSIASASGARDGSGNLTTTLVPRPRWSGSPVPDQPYGFVVQVWDSSAYATLIRTITVSAAVTAYYSAADQVADFGSNQSTVYLQVYQTNSLVGNGYPWRGSV